MKNRLPGLEATISFTVIFFFLVFPVFGFALTNANDVQNMGVDEKLGESVPLSLTFLNEDGEKVKLGSFFEGKKPVVLTLNYYECPLLCTYVLNGVRDAVNNTKSVSLGHDYNVVTLSFDPTEKPELAKKKGENYREALVDESRAESWHFLTGKQKNIKKLTQAVGFRYQKDGEEFAHPSALVVLTPEGEISRYLYGVEYKPKDFRLALLEASNGKIGSSELVNKVLLFCYQFDPVGKKYALQALNVVKAGGVITLLSLVGFLAYFWRRERDNS